MATTSDLKLTSEQIRDKLYAGELRDLAHLRGIRCSIDTTIDSGVIECEKENE